MKSGMLLTSLYTGLVLFFGVTSVSASEPVRSPNPVQKIPAPTTHIEYFGFAIVDCGHDDPNDSVANTNYTNEVRGFSNIAHIAAFDNSASIEPRLSAMIHAGLAPLLDVSLLVTMPIEDQSMPGGFRLELRPNASQILADWYAINHLDLFVDQIAAIYLVDEPIWNGLDHL